MRRCPQDFFFAIVTTVPVCLNVFLRTREESNAAYWQRISRKKEESSGRLVYRPSNNAPLGILDGKKNVQNPLCPDGSLATLPPSGGNQKSPNGQSNTALSNLLVLDNRAVAHDVVRAQPPAEVGDTNLASVFKSGISVAPPRLLQLEISCFHKLLQMT